MRIKAVRASNSDSGGRRRRRGGTKWGGESWEGGGEPLMMSLYTSLYLGFKEMQESWSGREESPRAAVARRLAVSIKTREGTGPRRVENEGSEGESPLQLGMDKADRCYRMRMACRTRKAGTARLAMYGHAGPHG